MTPGGPVGISGRGLTVRVRGRSAPVLDDVDVDAPPSRVTGLIGPNGSGKTTLLHTLSGAIAPGRGQVRVGGRALADVPRRERARTLAVMEQSGDTDTDLTVADVVALARLPHRGRLAPPTPQDEAACAHALDLVGMSGTGRRRWRTLSGGERQRVHAARALAQEPQVLLLDEPTNHLDVQHQHELLALLTGLAASGPTVVVVLHDLALAARYCDRLVVLRAGRVHAAGPTADALTAGTLRDVFGVRADVRRDDAGLRVEVLGPAGG
ncbi:ABC transporter ATP-binding protein [Cellulomonas sp. C5510]|uniref:ABC transporter ATP-binding protein n=1 Tax=Cellulomonas sp. C5510 TaxID=2871170 RepID=UPI0021062636|nr:ABC transporter ATP-binding protein [Cellulomonas sp. C5510]